MATIPRLDTRGILNAYDSLASDPTPLAKGMAGYLQGMKMKDARTRLEILGEEREMRSSELSLKREELALQRAKMDHQSEIWREERETLNAIDEALNPATRSAIAPAQTPGVVSVSPPEGVPPPQPAAGGGSPLITDLRRLEKAIPRVKASQSPAVRRRLGDLEDRRLEILRSPVNLEGVGVHGYGTGRTTLGKALQFLASGNPALVDATKVDLRKQFSPSEVDDLEVQSQRLLQRGIITPIAPRPGDPTPGEPFHQPDLTERDRELLGDAVNWPLENLEKARMRAPTAELQRAYDKAFTAKFRDRTGRMMRVERDILPRLKQLMSSTDPTDRQIFEDLKAEVRRFGGTFDVYEERADFGAVDQTPKRTIDIVFDGSNDRLGYIDTEIPANLFGETDGASTRGLVPPPASATGAGGYFRSRLGGGGAPPTPPETPETSADPERAPIPQTQPFFFVR